MSFYEFSETSHSRPPIGQKIVACLKGWPEYRGQFTKAETIKTLAIVNFFRGWWVCEAAVLERFHCKQRRHYIQNKNRIKITSL